MARVGKYYPNITWAQFAVCNDDATGAFEDMTRRLFTFEFLKNSKIPHADHNNPGVEVLPILEPPHKDGSKQRKISFQSKYFKGNVNFSKIKESLRQAVKHYGNELDLIYLFCNKTLTVTTKGYKETKAIVTKAGIELYPISNAEVLDLVSKYKEIANYFFLPRKRPDEASLSQIHTGIVMNNGKNAIGCIECPMQLKEQIIDPRLLQSFVQEKIELCKSFIMEMNLEKLREELDRILLYKINGIEGAETLFFYKLIADLHDGNDVETEANEITGNQKNELKYLIEYYTNPSPIGAYKFASHCIEVQVIILDKMFASQFWEGVIALCQEIVDDTSSEIGDIVKQYCGLAFFNLQQYDSATDMLKGLYQKTRKETVLLYSVLAEIKSINCDWREGHYELKDRLVELVVQLDSLKENKQYKDNKKLVAMLYLETAYNLGISEKRFVENAIERYQDFPEEVKYDSTVKYLYALCIELNGNIEIAEKLYFELAWEEDSNIACRYMICKLSKGEYAEAVTMYENLSPAMINTKLKSLYLTALFYTESDDYEKILKGFIDEMRGDFSGIIDIALGVREKKYIQTLIVPELKNHLNGAYLKNLGILRKIEILSILSIGEDVEYIYNVIKTVPDLKRLNRYIVKEIYGATFAICNKEFVNHDKVLTKSQKLDVSEQIADQFLEADVSRREFLQIKYLCAGAKEKRFSMLKYAKELFEITKEEGMARNIIAMLFERNVTDYNVYAPYINALRNSTKPDYCMAIASAMLRLGKTEEADLYAYKALYYLNDVDDYRIYKSYFGYYNQNLNRYHHESELKRVMGNSVVTLEENDPVDSQHPKIKVLCLDSESEFSDTNNRCMEVEHITSSDPVFLKIQGSGLNQVLKIDGINYKITQICSRAVFAVGFIFKKINQHPDKFDGSVWVISSEKPDELLKKMKLMMNRTEKTETLLNLYHFKENETGLPIDVFTEGNYDRYIDVLNMLLYAKDQALYTGYPIYESEENQKYVPSLSTMVLLSSMNLLHVLTAVKDSLILPESYVDFFVERYKKAKETSLMSTGKLINVDNQLTLIENDLSHVEIWERIIDFCTDCKMVGVSDDERIGFTFGKDINGEQLIAGMHLHLIHLDAFSLAAKERATLLCDDLFFRKMATYTQIRNINFVSILRHYINDDFVIPIILELSKTNYLYIPFLARTDEEAIELTKNILDGELKKKYYSDMLIAYNVAWENVMEEIFGEEI